MAGLADMWPSHVVRVTTSLDHGRHLTSRPEEPE